MEHTTPNPSLSASHRPVYGPNGPHNNPFDSYDSVETETNTPTSAKPCPGIPGDDVECGAEREPNTTYCKDCRRRYQNNRRQSKKLLETGQVTRRYTKTDGARPIPCSCCGITRPPSQLGLVNDNEAFPICRPCFTAVEAFIDAFDPRMLVRAARFIVASGSVLGLENASLKHDAIVKILFDKWYDEENDFLIEMKRTQPIDSPVRRQEVDPSKFKYTSEQYAEVARSLTDSSLVGRGDLFTESLLKREAKITFGGSPLSR
jgi:hypothetical protein